MPGENEDTLRATLESAYDEATDESAETERSEPVLPTPVPDDGEPATPPEEGADRGDGRDARGKFAPRKAVGDEQAADERPRPDAQTVTPQPPELPAHDPYARAPQSWRPGAREAWGSLPAPIREEVYRRERESQRVMSESAQARQVAGHIAQLQQTYAPALSAEGVDALTASSNLMNLASRLRFGTPIEKATLAATIIRNYGVDIAQLDQVLANGPAPQMQQPQMLQDPRVDQLLSQLNQMRSERQQHLVSTATREIETFGGDKEFFEDVRETMADLMEVAAKRGVDMALDEAYEQACLMTPEIYKVLAARAAAASAGTQKQSTQRSKHAASSVRGTPSGTSTPQATDLRGAIEAAIEQVGGR